MELNELQKTVQAYVDSGFMKDVVTAARQAQEATKLYIARTHPSTGFDGRNLSGMFVKGKFLLSSSTIDATVYANYFARWYNTGAMGRIIRGRGPRQGRIGPTYPPRGAYFESNAQAIKAYFLDYMVNYLKNHIKL